MGNFVRHEPCPNCGSKDNLARYDDGSAHCFGGCRYYELPESGNQKKKPKNKNKETRSEPEVSKAVITSEKAEEIKRQTTLSGNNFRGIKDSTLKYFGVRNSVDEFGDILERYYPVTQEGALVGYKVREVPKDFYSIGRTGAECELFCQFRFTRGGKYVILTEGEEDALAAYQMLKDYNKSKGSDFETAVVSATTGANSHKQIAGQYKFFDSFENIIISYDNDKAGLEAIDKIVKVLPKGKVRIMNNRYKDANEYLEKGAEKAFLNDFYNAKTYVPAGVVGSSELYNKLIESASTKRIPLPPFMHKLDDMLGHIELGTIGVIAAGTGAAKTTLANEMIYFWLFNCPYKIGVVSLELTCGQYAQALLSRHIEQKISSIKNPEDKLKLLSQDEVKEKANELFKTEDGSDRFVVIDERDGSIEVMKDKIEEMIISCGVKVIILDPVSDLFDATSLEEQADFMKFQKSMVKNYDVTFINIAHIRKGSSNKDSASTGAFVSEEGIIGASQQIKSASWVVMLSRDKYNEDEIVRNTTKITLSKNRANGVTGDAGSMYYCNETHRLFDLDDYLNNNFT